jgi:type IV pilus assembly protein PilB
MEKRLKFIGEILSELGLITHADVDRALAYQRECGGYFGEALIQLGVLSADQLNFGLADQFDLPFVHLKPDNIDQAVARMVPAEWAREHLIIPVLRDGGTVTVIVARPPREAELATVRRFTCATSVEPAISSADTVRALISAVHLDGCGEEIPALELLARAFDSGAERVGLSTRLGRTRGWYQGVEGTVRCCVLSGWEDDLQLALSPGTALATAGITSWPAVLTSASRAWRVQCSLAAGGGGTEWTADLGVEVPSAARAPHLSDDLAAAVDADGNPRLVVAASGAPHLTPELSELLVPIVPRALLRRRTRAIHVADRPVAALPDVMVVPAGDSPSGTLRSLAPLRLDAVTLQLEAYSAATLQAAREAAPLVVICSMGKTDISGVDLEVLLSAVDDSYLCTLSSSSALHGAD